MHNNTLGKTHLHVGALGYSERPKRRDPSAPLETSDIYEATPHERATVVQAALDAGVTLFHAAHEREAHSLGQSLQTLGVRDAVVLSTTDGDVLERCPDTEAGAREAVQAALIRKLTLLNVERIDLFSLYDVRREVHTAARLAGAFAALQEAQQAGTIGHFGTQCRTDFDTLADAIESDLLPCAFVLAPFSYAQHGALQRLLPLCREKQIGTITTGAFDWTGTGVPFTRFPNTWRLRNMVQNFAGLSAAQAHLRWIGETAAPDCVLVSMQTAAQITENAAAWTVTPSKTMSNMTSLLDEFREALFHSKEGWRGLLTDPDWETRAAAEARLARQRGRAH